MKKTTIATALGIVIGGASMGANAALTSGATLDFTLGTVAVTCNYGTTPPCNKTTYSVSDVVGSYFSMDTNGNGVENSEKTPIGSLNGIVLGATQAAGGSHAGSVNGSESPNIDAPWTFFGGTGMHQTTSAVTATAGGAVNMAGWNVAWNGIASIPLVQQSASIACSTSTCSESSNYTIDGAFHVNGAGFTTVAYTVHLEGHITDGVSAVPVPAAVWLFGSGLLGLAGVARRRKSA